MGVSTINFSRFLADPLNLRGASDNLVMLNELNQERFTELGKALESGETLDVELGCGDGEFAAKLSDRTRRWVIGIDIEPEQMFTFARDGWPRQYREAKKFLYLPYSYDAVLRDERSMFGWLEGRAEKTFMIMPDPEHRIGNLREEAGLWEKLAAPRGEMHMKSEEQAMLQAFGDAISRPYQVIPFWKKAGDIPSRYQRDRIYPGGRISFFEGDNFLLYYIRLGMADPATIIWGRGFRLPGDN